MKFPNGNTDAPGFFAGDAGTIERLFGFTCRIMPVARVNMCMHGDWGSLGGRQGEVFSLGQDTPKRASKDDAKARIQGKDRDMGSALRSIYLKTIEESVPAEMLDLLGKLD